MPRWTPGVLEMVKTLNRRRRMRWKPPSIRKHECHKNCLAVHLNCRQWSNISWSCKRRKTGETAADTQSPCHHICILYLLHKDVTTLFHISKITTLRFLFRRWGPSKSLGWFGTVGLTKNIKSLSLLLYYWLSSSSSSPPEVYPLFTMPPAVLGNCGLSLRATCSLAFNQSRFQYIRPTWLEK